MTIIQPGNPGHLYNYSCKEEIPENWEPYL